MKFSTSAILCLATTGAYAAAINPRDLDSVKQVLAAVQSAIDAVTSAAQVFDGNIQPVVDESNKLIDTMKTCTDKVKADAELSMTEAMRLFPPVKELQKHAESLSVELQSRIRTIEQAKGCAISRTQLDKIATDSKSLMDALVSKVPGIGRGLAESQVDNINAILKDTQASFAADKCVDA